MAISGNINYYPPIPGSDQNAANAYFQQNPQMQSGGMGGAIYGGGASAAQIGSGLGGAGANPSGFGFNLGTGQLALGTVGAISNIWAAYQAQKLAKEQFAFTKDMSNANFANSLKTYNTTLVDRSMSRGLMQGDDASRTQQYIEDNRLTDERKNK